MNLKPITAFVLFLFIVIGTADGQIKRSYFIGVQPSFTVEPFYAEGELDANIFPLVYEKRLGKRINLKLLPTLNYHIGGVENGISDVGLYTVLPIYFGKRDGSELKSYGFYLGPVLGFGRNLINDHYTTTIAVEPGYMFESKKKFTLAIGIQFGASHFSYDTLPNKWLSHWGPKVSLGYWLGGKKETN